MKKIKIFVGALLCMNLLTISGCDKVVHSAVVEEKDKTVVKTEENKEKETVQKTVTEQVQAPETYQTTIQSDLRSSERTDQENPMKFTLTADAPVEVPDVDAICLKNVKKATISEEEPQKVLDTFAKGQLLKQDYDGLAETYEVDGLTYQYTGTFPDLEAFSFLEKYAAFDDVNEENMSQDEKKQRAERFQNYIKAGNQNMTDDGAENYVKDIVSGEWHLFDSASKELTEENCTLEKTSFFFERMADGVPVNYIRNSYLPYDELSRPWIDEDDNFHEAKCDVWDNESLTMIFCSGTLQSFQHSDPIEVSDASDEALFLLPFDEIKDIFEKTITMQIVEIIFKHALVLIVVPIIPYFRFHFYFNQINTALFITVYSHSPIPPGNVVDDPPCTLCTTLPSRASIVRSGTPMRSIVTLSIPISSPPSA